MNGYGKFERFLLYSKTKKIIRVYKDTLIILVQHILNQDVLYSLYI